MAALLHSWVLSFTAARKLGFCQRNEKKLSALAFRLLKGAWTILAGCIRAFAPCPHWNTAITKDCWVPSWRSRGGTAFRPQRGHRMGKLPAPDIPLHHFPWGAGWIHPSTDACSSSLRILPDALYKSNNRGFNQPHYMQDIALFSPLSLAIAPKPYPIVLTPSWEWRTYPHSHAYILVLKRSYNTFYEALTWIQRPGTKALVGC